MKPVKSFLEKLSGISTPFLGVSWHPTSHKGLERKLVLLDNVIESYRFIESGIWKARDYLRSKRLSKDEAVAYLRPVTNKASETRDFIRAHQYEWGTLTEFINGIGLQALLCFAQLLVRRPVILSSVQNIENHAPELEETIRKIGKDLDALSYVVSLYHGVLNDGESALKGEDLEAFRWLNTNGA